MSITAKNVNIGASPWLTVSYSRAFGYDPVTWSLSWYCGSQTGTIVDRRAETTGSIYEVITDFVIPLSLYYEIPNSLETVVTYELLVYDADGSLLATEHGESTAYVNQSASMPVISLPSVTDVNELSRALTGDASKLIRYVSNAQVSFTVTARNGATIKNSHKIETWNGVNFFYGESGTIFNMSVATFQIYATDSRDLTTRISYTIPAENIVEYVKLTCNAGDERPDTDGKITLTCTGNYFNGSFGAVNNTLAVEYRYKEQGGTFGAWASMNASTNGNGYNASATITGLDYKTTYIFECRATDAVMTVSSAEKNTQATPVFHWSADDFVHETPVDFRAGIKINGKDSDFIEEQGTSGAWTYRKWSSGFAECWGRFSKTVYGSDWTAWGGLYQAEILTNEAYPFTFTDLQKELATLQSASGGLLNGSAWGMSTSTTGAYFAVHPNKLTSTYSVALNLYACGTWK